MDTRDTRRETKLENFNAYKALEAGHVVMPRPSYTGLKKQQPVNMWGHVNKHLDTPPVMVVDNPPASTRSDSYNIKFLN
jgi:hypothetical protein